MKVGDYCRTDTGIIAKIRKIIDYKKENQFEYLNFNDACVLTNEDDYYNDVVGCKGRIIKSSPNIIDLIEVGDYVNGFYVINKPFNQRIHTEFDDFFEEDIKSIVTHEQFSQMEYKMGD